MVRVPSLGLHSSFLDEAVARAVDEPDWAQGGFSPSTRWHDAGPLIEREGISIEHKPGGWINGLPGQTWMAYAQDDDERIVARGRTALEAAMRYLVTKRLGPYVVF